MSYYQYIQGVRYSRDLIDTAKTFTQGRGEGKISYEEIRELYRLAEDGRRITDTERRTLLYIAETFSLTDKAREWLSSKLKEPDQAGLESVINRVVRQEYNLRQLSWLIDPAEVRRQESRDQSRLFESALRGALDAFLYHNIDQLSLDAFVYRRNLAVQEQPTPQVFIREYLDQGTLFLVPEDTAEQLKLPYDVPDDLDLENFWVFGLHIPTFFPGQFLANVLRTQPLQHSKGYFSRRPDVDTLARAIIGQFLDFRLSWQLDISEIQHQLALMPGQNFGNALFAAVNGGIFNGESSFSFRDFIGEEIWQDPDLERQDYMRTYLNTGKLHLIPLDYQEGKPTTDFPLPQGIDLWLDGSWYFGIEMPKKTQVRFLINTPRDSHDGSTGWNDGFTLADDRPLGAQLLQVLADEFSLPDLNLIFPEEEFEAQRTQFGPEWRHAQALIRQAINTALNDYLEPRSVFNKVVEKHQGEVSAANYDDIQEYRTAVRFRIHRYLRTATLELLPIELPDNNPVDGEAVEENWLFFLLVPELSRVGFFIIIPRWPDDGQLPYVYHGE